MSEIFLDTETTGLSFKDGHKIVEIACIETKDLIPTDKIFHKLVNPDRDVPDEAFKIHGFSRDFLSKNKKFDQIADEFLEFIKNKKLIIHNANFDLNFLNGELGRIKKQKIDKDLVIDSLEVARNKFPGLSNSLDALCKRFRIDNSKREKHTALTDCELLSKVYINLLDQKEPKLNFNNLNKKKKNENNNLTNGYSKKIIAPSINEIKIHREFLKKDLKKNFF